MNRETKLGFVASIFLALLVLLSAGSAQAQNPAWFNTGTGLGDTNAKPRIAVPDFVPREDPTRQHAQLFARSSATTSRSPASSTSSAPASTRSRSPSVPNELKNTTWTDQPLNANMVAFGNLTQSATEVAIQAWLNDVRNPSGQPIIGKVYRGAPTDAQVRKFAHQFADEIISKLSGGIPGIASTQIAFRQLAHRHQRNLGDGLRRPKPAPAHLSENDLAYPALVARPLAYRLHLLRAIPWPCQPANLHVLR